MRYLGPIGLLKLSHNYGCRRQEGSGEGIRIDLRHLSRVLKLKVDVPEILEGSFRNFLFPEDYSAIVNPLVRLQVQNLDAILQLESFAQNVLDTLRYLKGSPIYWEICDLLKGD